MGTILESHSETAKKVMVVSFFINLTIKKLSFKSGCPSVSIVSDNCHSAEILSRSRFQGHKLMGQISSQQAFKNYESIYREIVNDKLG